MLSDRSITWGLTIVVISMFAAFFVMKNYTFDAGDRMEQSLNEISESIQEGDWNKAEAALKRLERTWNKGRYLVALNNAEQNFSETANAVRMLRGAIEVRDSERAVEMAKQIHGNWVNFKKIVPE